MGVRLPAELAGLLTELGFLWPEVDEESLFRQATAWLGFGGRLDEAAEHVDAIARAVRDGNGGAAISSFLTVWTGEDAPRTVVSEGTTGARVVGVCLVVCAALVLALKIAIIVQLSALLVRIYLAAAASPASSGASLLWIPVYKRLTGLLVNMSMYQASRVLVA
ncbi:WXG100-like domain-containing protein [Nonomuraea sp. LPB2021202275-12-8]|uniref:WXG100-like domain-containing protein n=1 Tax=Nonomuraea sp. LPB2021202275-12-8 TaxID=3120159 RepID=UPI00300C2254